MKRPLRLLLLRPIASGVGIGIAAAVLGLGAIGTASADPEVTWQSPSVSIEYGDPWSVQLFTPWTGYSTRTVVIDDQDGEEVARITPPQSYNTYVGMNWYFGSQDFPELAAGEYTITGTFEGDGLPGGTSAPLPIVVSPAPVSARLEVEADPAAPRNAVLTVQLAGKFADRNSYDEEYGYVSPRLPIAGTWKVDVADSTGETIFSDELPQASGDLAVATMYWANVPTGQTFTGSATFTPAADSGDYAIADALGVSYTPPPVQSTGTTGTAPAAPVETEGDDAAGAPLSVPLWSVVGAAVVSLIALIASAISAFLLVRRRRRAAVADTALSDRTSDAVAPIEETSHV
ncbi:hypothetical protein [Naasia lichenicola]|uniref:Uncharacterized protein n=1 Tax=Naasia lichenicola TaxID=2565933 RepID=A0A4S4FHT0_9MICO|nr:hypothetical protein [Naasia lichenicola]THG29364.1 hypothetical protein E6C64_11660 [Naasia lichenicola]